LEHHRSTHADLNKYVSLTFDESPEVRKQAAFFLGQMDDPAAIFALMELSFDKDTTVRDTAQIILNKRKQNEAELMSFAEVFATDKKEEMDEKGEKRKLDKKEQAKVDEARKDRVLSPISKLFERHLGKEKAEAVKSKMMPAIEKIYLNSKSRGDDNEAHDETGRKAMQEFLTSYMEVISDIESIEGARVTSIQSSDAPAVLAPTTEPQATSSAEAPMIQDSVNEPALRMGLDVVGRADTPDEVSTEITLMDQQEVTELKEEEGIGSLPDTYFKKAYEMMMLSNGDEKIMRGQMERMVDDARREIGLAFKMAKKRFKETNVTNLTNIKDGMRNINTDILIVKSSESSTYQKTKTKSAAITRVVLNDLSGNEAVLYLPEDRGLALKSGMKVKVRLAMVKSFPAETALVIGRKGNVYIVL
jgi:hypothetical protein